MRKPHEHPERNWIDDVVDGWDKQKKEKIERGLLEEMEPDFFVKGETLAKQDDIFAKWWNNRPATFSRDRHNMEKKT